MTWTPAGRILALMSSVVLSAVSAQPHEAQAQTALITSPPPPPPFPPTVFASPVWLEQPTAQDAEAVYPAAARADGMGGYVRLICRVTVDWQLERCEVITETPIDYGFGEAALALVPRYRMKPFTPGAPANTNPDLQVGIALHLDPPVKGVTLSSPTVPPSAASAAITHPTWLSRPTGEDFARVFPRRAAQAGQSGRATLACTVAASGTLTGCRVANEDPPGAGFGQAAMKLAPKFRMAPTALDGSPTEGRSIRIPIRFMIG